MHRLAVDMSYRSVCDLALSVRDSADRYVADFADIEERIEFADRQYAAVIVAWQRATESGDREITEQDLIDTDFRREWERFQAEVMAAA